MKHLHAHIILLFIAFVTMAAVATLYVYMYYSINDSFAQVALARSILNSEKQNSVEEQNVRKMYEDTREKRTYLSKLFIGDDQAITFIESLEKLGQITKSTVTLSSVSADETSSLANGSIAHISAKLDAVGPWQSIMRTLILSENLPYQSSLGPVNLTLGSGDPKTGKREWHISYKVTGTILVHATSTPIKIK